MSNLIKPAIGLFSLLTVLTGIIYPLAVTGIARWAFPEQATGSLILADGQALAVKQGYVPAHPDVALPAGYPPRAEIKIMSFDPAKALADETRNKKDFADIFGQ